MVWFAYSRTWSALGERWDGEAKRLGSFRFDHQFVLGRVPVPAGRHTAMRVSQRDTEKSESPWLSGEPYILTRTQVVVGAVITRHPARQFRMRIGAADGIDFLYAGRVDSELHD